MKEEIDSLLRSSMDICLKPSRLPCGKSPSVCLLKHIPHCCWCTDTRSIAEKNTVFLDKYGFVDLRDYRVNVPIDIHYCPGCKCSTESRDDLVKELEKLNPSVLESLENAEQARLRKEARIAEAREKHRIAAKIQTEKHHKRMALQLQQRELAKQLEEASTQRQKNELREKISELYGQMRKIG